MLSPLISEGIPKSYSHSVTPKAKNTFLVYHGEKLPAKHIRGMACRHACGKEISKDEYAGGRETADFYRCRGFDAEDKGSLIKGEGNDGSPWADGPEGRLISADRKYIILNIFDEEIPEDLYEEQLDTVLKVRAMENCCAAVLYSTNIRHCCQTGYVRAAQKVKENRGRYGIALER